MTRQHTRSANTLLITLVVAIAVTLFQLVHACERHDRSACQPTEDFAAFYNAGQHAAVKETDVIYNTGAAHDVLNPQKKVDSFLPFLYPPHSLLFLSVFHFADYATAFAVSFFVSLLLFFALLNTEHIREMVWLPFSKSLIVMFPFLLMTFLAGQPAILWAALFLLVLMWRDKNPICAGLVLSLFSIKPQLGILLPILLLYEKNWKVIAVAILATLAMAALSVLIWGTGLWVHYGELLRSYVAIVQTAPEKFIGSGSSPLMAFRMFLPLKTALWLQASASLMVFVMTLSTLPRCRRETQLVLLLSTATLLFSAYSFTYDSMLLALPCLILFQRVQRGEAGQMERIALILMAFIPILAIKLQYMHIPYSFMVILFTFLMTTISLGRAPHAFLPA